MVYEVCAIVLTIIFSMVGVYIIIVLHTTKGFVTEAKQSLKVLNENLPELVSEMLSILQGIRSLTISLLGGIEKVSSTVINPLMTISRLMDIIKHSIEIWKISRKGQGKKEST